MKKTMFGVAALVLALAAAGGAHAQQSRRGPALAPEAEAKKEWQGVSAISNGKALPAADAKAARVTTDCDGSKFTLDLGGRTVMKGTYKLDKSTTPKQVDLITSSGAGKGAGALLKGIFEVNGDTLKVCCAPAGQPRPTAFTSEPGSGHQLFVMQRVK